jgi:hypothetical protein
MRLITRLRTGGKRHMLLAAVISAATLLLAACVGHGEGDSGSGGSDAAYVKAICEANVEMQENMESVLAKATAGADPVAALMKAIAELFEDFLDDVEDANPPSDMRTTHDALLEGIEKTIELMKSGDPAVLEGDSPLYDVPEPPPAVEERLTKVAEDEPACEEADNFS